jgi:hypothetical protein
MPLYEYSQSMLNVPILICLPRSDGRITHQQKIVVLTEIESTKEEEGFVISR